MADPNAYFGPSCGVGHFSDGLCSIFKPYPKDTTLLTLGECQKDISKHLASLKIDGGSQTVFGAADSEGQVICYRIGIFRYDPSMSVCPYHRYTLGLHWKPPRKCSFPIHEGQQKPQRGISAEMSRNILNSYGVLVKFGSGICLNCLEKYKHVCGIEEESEQLKGSEDDEDIPSTSTHGYSLRAYNNANTYDSDSQLTNSQTSNWSDEMDTTLQKTNEIIQVVTGGNVSPLRGQLHTDISEASDSTRRYYKRKAEESIESLLNIIAPGQSEKLRQLIHPEQTTQPPEEELTKTILKLYEETTDNKLRSQILSVISKKLTKTEIMQRLPGISKYKIDQARLASKSINGLEVGNKTKVPRKKMDEEKMQHAIDFFFNPIFHQIVSYGTRDLTFDTGEKITIPDIVRTVCHTQIVHMYLSYCKENNFKPLGKSSLYEILRACAASKRTNLHGLDNIAAEGVDAFKNLHDLVNTFRMEGVISDECDKELKSALVASRIYMKTDFKLHIKNSDLCADHCISWSLSDQDTNFQNQCNHNHTLTCDRCQVLVDVFSELSKIVTEMENEENKNEYSKIISDSKIHINNWKSHIVRTVNQDQFRIDTIEQLQDNHCLLIMDWAMKFLPLKYRETQSDWFGQRGRNWHVIVCIYKDTDGSINVSL